MRRRMLTLCFSVSAAAAVAWADETLPGAPAPTTVFFKFEGPTTSAVFDSMKREMSALFAKTPYRFEWRRLEEATEIGPVPNLVVLRLRGDCRMTYPFPPMDEQGLFAWTEVTDGVVLPFSTVDCDRVRNAVSTAVWGGERKRGEELLGRALGRILAHELFHIFSKSGAHTAKGLAKRAVTGAELIANDTVFHPEDLHRLPEPRNSPN